MKLQIPHTALKIMMKAMFSAKKLSQTTQKHPEHLHG